MSVRVRALKSFAGRGVHVRRGDVFELPADVDWLQAGLVEVVEVEKVEIETAELPKPEQAVKRVTRRRAKK